MTETYHYEEEVFQRGPSDWTLEKRIVSTTGKVISRSLIDVLVYDCDSTGKCRYVVQEILSTVQEQPL